MTTLSRSKFRGPLLHAGAALVLSALAACGGGGGGGHPLPSEVAVTAANQMPVARAALGSVLSGAVGGPLGPTAAAPQSAAQVSLRRVAAVGRKSVQAGTPVALCVTGSATATPTSATSATIDFVNCDVGGGVFFGGRMGINYTAVTATALSADVALSSFTIQEPAIDYAATMNGAFSFTAVDGTVTASLDMTVPEWLEVGVTFGAVADTFTLLDHYTISSVYTVASTLTSTTATGPVASATAGGFVRVSTPQPLLQLDAETYPHAGRMLVTGVRGRLQASVLSETNVQVELDENGDGTFEASTTVAWTTLL